MENGRRGRKIDNPTILLQLPFHILNSFGHGVDRMFSSSVQTSPLSLFSSTSSHPFALFSLHCNHEALPEDAGIVLLHEGHPDKILSVAIGSPSFSIKLESFGKDHLLETVAHIQSPTIKDTFIRSPPNANDRLGLTLPHIHFHLRPLGVTRPFYIEVGVQDRNHRVTRLRCSTFQKKAIVYPPRDDEKRRGPLLHLPLVLPPRDETTVTDWMVMTLSLPPLMAHFNKLSLLSQSPDSGNTNQRTQMSAFAQVDYIEVHANVRLRRIWLTAEANQPHQPDAIFSYLPALRVR